MSYYQRKLPDSCIPFNSKHGKLIFREAMDKEYMEIYFTLAEQFVTQSEPAFCGVSTLTMVLNGLKLDPDRQWKGPWRWFSESLLDCCKPLERVKVDGISFSEFACLARCNGAIIQTYQAGTVPLSMETFREAVKKSTQSCKEILVINYNRQVLGQTGTGHFSPIGGYHPGNDQVLILDVARFKYPPHWVSLGTVFQALSSVQSRRGYILLSSPEKSNTPTILQFPTMAIFRDHTKSIKKLLDSIESYTIQQLLQEVHNAKLPPLHIIIPNECHENNKESISTIHKILANHPIYHTITTYDLEKSQNVFKTTYGNPLETHLIQSALVFLLLCIQKVKQVPNLHIEHSTLRNSIEATCTQLQSILDLQTLKECSKCNY